MGGVYFASLMRRFLSIATICALLASPAAPVFAAACPHAHQVMACHRVEHVHHCATMQHEEGDAADAESADAAVLQSITPPSDCPMDCCAPGQRTNAIAIVVIPISSPSFLSEPALQFTPAVFVASGFSSHTDRGPPTA